MVLSANSISGGAEGGVGSVVGTTFNAVILSISFPQRAVMTFLLLVVFVENAIIHLSCCSMSSMNTPFFVNKSITVLSCFS